MRPLTRLAAGAALVMLAPSVVSAQAGTRPSPRPLQTSAEAEFVTGRSVYLRSTGTRIGIITSMDAQHRFPRGFPQPVMKAVRVKRVDGPEDWVPVQGLNRIYVVRR